MRTAPLGRAGSTLVLNLLIMSLFAMMSVIVYKGASTMVGEVVYHERSTQALAIAEAGMEDALHALYSTSSWRTGFNQKPFAGGYYTVSLATVSAISLRVTSTGHSPPRLLTGRAVKTVSASVLFVSSTNPTNAIMSSDLEIYGIVNAYDPRVSLTPSSESFTDGGIIWADSVTTGGACATPRIFSGVIVYNAAAPAIPPATSPGAGCVNTPANTISSTNTAVSLPLRSCNAACQAVAATYNAQINVQNPVTLPFTPTDGGALTIGQGQVVTLSSGTYYMKEISVDKGTLNLDTTNGPIIIYYTNAFTMFSTSVDPCAVNNLSKIPSRLIFADVVGAHTVTLVCPAPLHAYLEGSANHFILKSGQEMFGHFSGAKATIETGATLHFDMSMGVPATHVTWTTGPLGTWAESYKRQ